MTGGLFTGEAVGIAIAILALAAGAAVLTAAAIAGLLWLTALVWRASRPRDEGVEP